MFHFPGCPPTRLWIHRVVTGLQPAGFPHSDILGFYACLRLPEAFRSLPRPSSAISAMASTLCSFLLDLSTRRCRPARFSIPKPAPLSQKPTFVLISRFLCLPLCSFQGARCKLRVLSGEWRVFSSESGVISSELDLRSPASLTLHS